MKSISEDVREVHKEAREPIFNWELCKFGLGIIAVPL